MCRSILKSWLWVSWLHSLPVRVITCLQQKRRQKRSKVERFSSHFRFLDQTTFHLASPNKQALHTLRGHWRRIWLWCDFIEWAWFLVLIAVGRVMWAAVLLMIILGNCYCQNGHKLPWRISIIEKSLLYNFVAGDVLLYRIKLLYCACGILFLGSCWVWWKGWSLHKRAPINSYQLPMMVLTVGVNCIYWWSYRWCRYAFWLMSSWWTSLLCGIHLLTCNLHHCCLSSAALSLKHYWQSTSNLLPASIVIPI